MVLYFYCDSDIDECAKNLHGCKNSANFNNTAGNYTCFCPVGQTGDGTKEGGCKLPKRNTYIYFIGKQQNTPNFILCTFSFSNLMCSLSIYVTDISLGNNPKIGFNIFWMQE
jgi:hypothetical protein